MASQQQEEQQVADLRWRVVEWQGQGWLWREVASAGKRETAEKIAARLLALGRVVTIRESRPA